MCYCESVSDEMLKDALESLVAAAGIDMSTPGRVVAARDTRSVMNTHLSLLLLPAITQSHTVGEVKFR